MTIVNTNCFNEGSEATSVALTPNGANYDVALEALRIGHGVPVALKWFQGAEPSDPDVVANPDQTVIWDDTVRVTQELAAGDWRLKAVPTNGLTGTGIVSATFTVPA